MILFNSFSFFLLFLVIISLAQKHDDSSKKGNNKNNVNNTVSNTESSSTITNSPDSSNLQSLSSSNAQSPYLMMASGYCIPKADPGKNMKAQCGEDAFYINLYNHNNLDQNDSNSSPSSSSSSSPNSPSKQSPLSFLAVADGVGGWRESGGDSSLVSNGLLHQFTPLISSQKRNISSMTNLVSMAFSNLKPLNLRKGTTTVCSASFNHYSGELAISNLGDSQLVILRNGKIVLEVPVGIEGFNTPKQIGFDHSGSILGNVHQMASIHQFILQPKDIVLVASDGIFDNIFMDDLATLTSTFIAPLFSLLDNQSTNSSLSLSNQSIEREMIQERLDNIAMMIVGWAVSRAKEKHWTSPFSEEAQRMGFFMNSGGKPDDTTLVIAIVGNRIPSISIKEEDVSRTKSKDEL